VPFDDCSAVQLERVSMPESVVELGLWKEGEALLQSSCSSGCRGALTPLQLADRPPQSASQVGPTRPHSKAGAAFSCLCVSVYNPAYSAGGPAESRANIPHCPRTWSALWNTVELGRIGPSPKGSQWDGLIRGGRPCWGTSGRPTRSLEALARRQSWAPKYRIRALCSLAAAS